MTNLLQLVALLRQAANALEDAHKALERIQPVERIAVDKCDLSARARKGLRRNGYEYLDQVASEAWA